MEEEDWKRISITLGKRADTLLRARGLRRRGDLSKFFREALTNSNWHEADVVTRRKTYQPFYKTSVSIPVKLYESLKQCARERAVEIGALIDAILISYYSRPRGKA